MPAYIAIEGPIGVGKSTLARALARRFNAELILEPVDENPFLSDFYQDRERLAFQTQLFFLLNRFQQQEKFAQPGLFNPRFVGDYLFAKDQIFASLTLSRDERALYDQVYGLLAERVPKPDLVIYLQASTEILLQRIEKRGREFERDMDPEYLKNLSRLYNDFFFGYNETPLLVIQTGNVDFASSQEDLDLVIETIDKMPGGTHYLVVARDSEGDGPLGRTN